jgi:hypothetical protein
VIGGPDPGDGIQHSQAKKEGRQKKRDLTVGQLKDSLEYRNQRWQNKHMNMIHHVGRCAGD